MAARRLGTVLTNITGTSGQILRVKTDESGFEFYTPTGLPAYTITNDTTDRVIDADVTTADELADVLATLIKDITTLVGGPVAFQWSTSEQVWPFEKDLSGRTLYCKEIDLGDLPQDGIKTTSLGNINTQKIFKYYSATQRIGSDQFVGLPAVYGNPATYSISLFIGTPAGINLRTFTTDYGTGWSTWIRIIYAK